MSSQPRACSSEKCEALLEQGAGYGRNPGSTARISGPALLAAPGDSHRRRMMYSIPQDRGYPDASPLMIRFDPYSMPGSGSGGAQMPRNIAAALPDKNEYDSAYGTDPNQPDSITVGTQGSTAYSTGSQESHALEDEGIDMLQGSEILQSPQCDEEDGYNTDGDSDQGSEVESAYQDAEDSLKQSPSKLKDDGKQETMDLVMDAFWEIFGCRFGPQDEPTPTDESSTEYGTSEYSSLSPSDAGQEQPGRSARRSLNDCNGRRRSSGGYSKTGSLHSRSNGEDNGEGDSKHPGVTSATGPKGGAAKKFACHYSKKYPGHSRLRPSCFSSGFQSVHRVKEHIFRAHILPTQCSMCFKTFRNDRELTEHHVHNKCPREGTQEELLGLVRGEEQELALRRRQERTSEVERWFAVWRILFPNDEPIPSPYYEPPRVLSHSQSYESFSNYDRDVRENLPRLVMRRIHEQYPSARVAAELLIRQLPELIRTEQANIAANHPEVQEYYTDRLGPFHTTSGDASAGARDTSRNTSEIYTQTSDIATTDQEAAMSSAAETQQSSVISAGAESGYARSPHNNPDQNLMFQGPQFCPPQRQGDHARLPPGGLHNAGSQQGNITFSPHTPVVDLQGNMDSTLQNQNIFTEARFTMTAISPSFHSSDLFFNGSSLNGSQFPGVNGADLANMSPDYMDCHWDEPFLMPQANNSQNSPSDFSRTGHNPSQMQ